ncbi:glycosyltransferase family 92 protein [Trichonephila clavipes]|nr:glycosyltransferase family 92 protein [Trichonephila clavipes]
MVPNWNFLLFSEHIGTEMGWTKFRIIPARAFKKILYGICIWTCLCYLVFKITNHKGAVTYLTARVNRGLLQNVQSMQALAAAAAVAANADFPTTSPPVNQDNPTGSRTPGIPQNFLDLEPQVDNSPALNEKQLLTLLANHSNLPLAYWSANKLRPIGSKSCVKFPSLYELDFNNIYWQRLQTSNGTYYLYGAYYDNRWRAGNAPVVRILGMIDRIKPIPTICQLWFDKKKMVIFSQATYTYAWYSKWGNYKNGILQPFVISCKVPSKESGGQVPTSVSLVENRCDKPTTNLRVMNERPPKKQDFAVCVKGLDFLHEDLSVRLVEWLELLNILGAKKIFLYDLEIHPNISKVLNYYQKEGLVQLTPLTLPGNQPNLPGFRHLYLKSKLTHKRQNELIPYNDCLYRNLYSYEYVVLLDIDEIIMPVKYDSWSELMKEVVQLALKEKNYTRASYNVRNVYFLDDLQDGDDLHHEAHELGIPRYLHMFQHVYRSKNFTKPGSYVKCFHNTERVVSLHNHFPLNCLGTCTTYSINTSLAQLQHYRKDCVGSLKNSCKTDFRLYTLKDTTIWRYKDEAIKRTTRTLSKLGFFS